MFHDKLESLYSFFLNDIQKIFLFILKPYRDFFFHDKDISFWKNREKLFFPEILS